MKITVWSTFISEINPLLEGMSNESRSSAEGDGDDELVVLVFIYNSSVHQHANSTWCQLFIRRICMHISTSIQHITFPTNPQLQTSQRPSSIQLHHKCHPDSPLPEDTLPWPEKVLCPSHSILPRSTTQPRYMTYDGWASWNSTFNPLTQSHPSSST